MMIPTLLGRKSVFQYLNSIIPYKASILVIPNSLAGVGISCLLSHLVVSFLSFFLNFESRYSQTHLLTRLHFCFFYGGFKMFFVFYYFRPRFLII